MVGNLMRHFRYLPGAGTKVDLHRVVNLAQPIIEADLCTFSQNIGEVIEVVTRTDIKIV